MTLYNDYPLEEIAAAAEKEIAAGKTVYQKWTCKACGERVTMGEPNVFFTTGRHDECPVEDGYLTELAGCNYMVIETHVPAGTPFNGETQR